MRSDRLVNSMSPILRSFRNSVFNNAFPLLKTGFTFLFKSPLSSYNPSAIFRSYSKSRSISIASPTKLINNNGPIQLPTLNAIIKAVRNSDTPQPVKDTIIVYVHHPLQTSVSLLQSIIDLGADPKNVFVLGKHYSECPSVVEQIKKMNVYYQDCSAQIGLGLFHRSFTYDLSELWSAVKKHIESDHQPERKKIMILDHGGHAVNTIPQALLLSNDIVAIEKTTAGLVNINKEGVLPPFPIIGVANSATKRVLESPLIAQAIVTKLQAAGLMQFENEKLDCGVVGYGAVGKALTDMLLSLGHHVTVYDVDPTKVEKLDKNNTTTDLNALVASTSYIFGCTGQDISSAIDIFRLSNQNKTLISCSSEDAEYLSLLKEVQRLQNGKVAKKPLADVIYTTAKNASIKVVRGGFPANFDNSGESVPAKDIDLTRSLVLCAVIQAAKMLRERELLDQQGIYALSAQMQSFIANTWLSLNNNSSRYSESINSNFKNIKWIQQNSGGISSPLPTEPSSHKTINSSFASAKIGRGHTIGHSMTYRRKISSKREISHDDNHFISSSPSLTRQKSDAWNSPALKGNKHNFFSNSLEATHASKTTTFSPEIEQKHKNNPDSEAKVRRFK